MEFTLACPICKHNFKIKHHELNKGPLKCCLCGNAVAPDIMTAYQNVGKRISDIYGCCKCGEQKQTE